MTRKEIKQAVGATYRKIKRQVGGSQEEKLWAGVLEQLLKDAFVRGSNGAHYTDMMVARRMLAAATTPACVEYCDIDFEWMKGVIRISGLWDTLDVEEKKQVLGGT